MAIRRQRPEAQVDWLAEAHNAGILTGHPALRRVLISPRRPAQGDDRAWPARWRDFWKALRHTPYEAVLDLQCLLKSAIFIKIASGGRKIGFLGGKEPLAALAFNERLPAYDPDRHALERYLDLLEPLGLEQPAQPEFGLEPSPAELRLAWELLGRLGRQRPLVLLHPMAKWESKLWPTGHWVELARRLVGAGADLALTGSTADRQVTAEISGWVAAGERLLDLAGRADLKTLAALQRLARVVVSTDTGTMHLAAAVGAPVVALFGPTSARRTGPYGSGHTVLSLGLECQPCFRRTCPRPHCLEELLPEQVARAVLSLLEQKSLGASGYDGESGLGCAHDLRGDGGGRFHRFAGGRGAFGPGPPGTGHRLLYRLLRPLAQGE
jgi:heptosyltransferase-1